jgi:LPXTG-motif cell wall-anchored protein
MRPLAVAGTPDGLGEVTTTHKVLIGAAVLALALWFLRKR